MADWRVVPVPTPSSCVTGLFSLARHRYTLWIFLLATVGVFTSRLIDFAFLDQANNRFQNEDELARLFGVLFGGAQAVTLVLLTFVTGPLLNRFGIATGMMLRQVALTSCFVVTIVVLFTVSSGAASYWLALTAKVMDLVLFSAITVPSCY